MFDDKEGMAMAKKYVKSSEDLDMVGKVAEICKSGIKRLKEERVIYFFNDVLFLIVSFFIIVISKHSYIQS